jgi:hypothetical protein
MRRLNGRCPWILPSGIAEAALGRVGPALASAESLFFVTATGTCPDIGHGAARGQATTTTGKPLTVGAGGKTRRATRGASRENLA